MRKVLRIHCPKKFHFWAKTVSVSECQPWRAAAQNRKVELAFNGGFLRRMGGSVQIRAWGERPFSLRSLWPRFGDSLRDGLAGQQRSASVSHERPGGVAVKRSADFRRRQLGLPSLDLAPMIILDHGCAPTNVSASCALADRRKGDEWVLGRRPKTERFLIFASRRRPPQASPGIGDGSECKNRSGGATARTTARGREREVGVPAKERVTNLE
jgi:hypothetical protein